MLLMAKFSSQKTVSMRCNCGADGFRALAAEASCCFCTTRHAGA
jgi:hypothetical protein